MSKLTTLFVAAGAYTLGARAGRSRYDQIIVAVQGLRHRTTTGADPAWTQSMTRGAPDNTAPPASEQAAPEQTARPHHQVP